MLQFIVLNILNEQLRSQQPSSCELIESLSTSLRNEMSSLSWQLSLGLILTIGSNLLKLFREVGFIELDKAFIVLQISHIFSIVDLLNVVFEFMLSRVLVRLKSRHILQEVLDQSFLSQELSILDIKIEDSPNISRLQVWQQKMLIVLSNVRYVFEIGTEVLQSLDNLILDDLDLCRDKVLLSSFEAFDDVVEDPNSFILQLFWLWLETTCQLELEALWDVILFDIDVLLCAEQVIVDLFCDELVVPALQNSFLLTFVFGINVIYGS